MQMINQALLVTLLIAGTFCQKIVFDNTTFISPCTTGARSGIDKYFITGTIGENITELLTQKWQPAMFIRVLRTSSSQFNLMCQFIIRGATCDPSPATSCGCFYNTITDKVHFTANNTVQADDNNAVIRAQWQHTNLTSIYSNTNYTLKDIYDVNAGQLTLTVAGVTENLPSGSCSFSLTLNRSNDLELCCSNTAKPCYPQISFNGAVVANNTEMCVTYPTSQLASDGVTGVLDLSYLMCTKTDYNRGKNCSVIPKPDETTTESTSSTSPITATGVTTTTTESSSSSSIVTASPTPSPDTCKVICPAIIVPVVVAIIIIVVISVCCCKKHKICCCRKRKRSKAVSDSGNENADDVHTSEHPKKDRQYPEYTNQAYDGRRSSPSDVAIDGVNTTTHGKVQQHNTVQEKDSNKPISGRTNDGSASQTVPGNPRQLPPLKGTHTHGQLHPTTAESRPISIEITTNTVKL